MLFLPHFSLHNIWHDMLSLSGSPFDPDGLVTNAVANIICSLVFGRRFEYSDQSFKMILLYFDDVVQLPANFWGQVRGP